MRPATRVVAQQPARRQTYQQSVKRLENRLKHAPVRSRRHFMAWALGVWALRCGTARAAGNALDGRVFIADAGERGKAADEKDDVITFANGTFHSSICDQWGYGKGEVRLIAGADELRFEVETVSEKDGRLKWQGRVTGDSIEGTFIHYRKPSFFRPNPDPVEHWFKGKPKI